MHSALIKEINACEIFFRQFILFATHPFIVSNSESLSLSIHSSCPCHQEITTIAIFSPHL